MTGPTHRDSAAMQRWAELQRLFHEGRQLPADRRSEWFEGLSDVAPELRAQLAAMLERDQRPHALLDQGAAALADVLLDFPGPDDLRGVSFGPYRITNFIGSGGMGIVYEVRRDDVGLSAALKILKDGPLSAARRERFAVEQHTVATLRHPAIAQLLDAGTLADGTPWSIMERVDGVPLDQWIVRRNPPLRQRLDVFRQIAQALQHAHMRGIIHCDLKPSNVLVTDEGHAKVVDFGIARHVQAPPTGPASDGPPAGPAEARLPLHSPRYAAPEQRRDAEVDTRTDIFGLGLLLHVLLVGSPPDLRESGPRESGLEDAARQAADSPHGVRALSRAQWQDLQLLMAAATNPDPDLRPASVDALLADLDRFEQGRPLSARDDEVLYRLRRFARRQRLPLATAAVALVALVVMSAAWARSLITARDLAVAEAARAERIQLFTTGLFTAGDPEYAPPDSLRVIDLLALGELEARALVSDPRLQIDLLTMLADVYAQIGALDRAEPLLAEAQAQAEALAQAQAQAGAQAGTNLPAGTLVNLLESEARLRIQLAEYDLAERSARQALDLALTRLPDGHLAHASALLTLAQVLEGTGDYEAARGYALRALASDGGSELPLATRAAALGQLVNLAFYLGDYATADSLGNQVLALNRDRYGDEHPSVAVDLVNLGAIGFETGQFSEAERYFRQALDIQIAWYGEAHPAVAANQIMLTRPLIEREQFDEARDLLEAADATLRRATGDDHPRLASIANELGRIAHMNGEYDEAVRQFTRMAAVYERIYPEGHYYEGIALSNLAGVLQARGDPDAAARMFDEVLRVYDRTLPADHSLVGIARIRLGGALAAGGLDARARSELESGRALLERAGSHPTWIEFADDWLGTLDDDLRP